MSEDLAEFILSQQKAREIEVVTVHVREWGRDVHLRMLSGDERDEFERACLDVDERTGAVTRKDGYRGRFLAVVLCNAEGERLYGRKRIDDAARAIGGLPGNIVDRLFTKAADLNGLTEKDIEDLEGNSEGGHSDASISSSRDSSE